MGTELQSGSTILTIWSKEKNKLFSPSSDFSLDQIDAARQLNLHINMYKVMLAANGVGLAAPQIGMNKRFCVIAADNRILFLFNPRITLREGERTIEEGCLSIPGQYGRVKRSERVHVEALDEFSKSVIIEVDYRSTPLLAQALEHEIDHLDGKLYTSRLVS